MCTRTRLCAWVPARMHVGVYVCVCERWCVFAYNCLCLHVRVFTQCPYVRAHFFVHPRLHVSVMRVRACV